MSEIDISEDELEITYDQDPNGLWVARVFHKSSSTIKISDYHLNREDARKQAIEELKELVSERMKGLGKR